MTPMEILHKIVETEDDAHAVYDEAVSIREGFDKYVQDHIDVIKKEHFDRAEKAIAAFDAEETKRADDAVIKLDKKLEADLAAAKTKYEAVKETAVIKIFKLAVGVDA